MNTKYIEQYPDKKYNNKKHHKTPTASKSGYFIRNHLTLTQGFNRRVQ
ncbi:MAG: hypothetical protein WBB02_01040 [Saprospiraceae bacterium]